MTAARRLTLAPLAALALLVGVPCNARAQVTAPPPGTATAPAVAPPIVIEDSDLGINAAEPDFALAALPTTLRMPAGKFAFRMTHRFSRPIAGNCPAEDPKPEGCGGVGGFFENFFGFDSPAKIGLEVRYGIIPGTQLTLHRTNDRAIQVLGQSQMLRQSPTRIFSLDVVGAIEGQNNFRENHTASAGVIFSHQVAERGALYLQPIFVFNSNPISDTEIDDNHTVMLGLGGRLRIRSSNMYVVAEAAPRLVGYKPGVDHISVGVEHRVGGHMFQLNVSNSFGSTLRQIALGGRGDGDWFVGFNLSRRFF